MAKYSKQQKQMKYVTADGVLTTRSNDKTSWTSLVE